MVDHPENILDADNAENVFEMLFFGKTDIEVLD